MRKLTSLTLGLMLVCLLTCGIGWAIVRHQLKLSKGPLGTRLLSVEQILLPTADGARVEAKLLTVELSNPRPKPVTSYDLKVYSVAVFDQQTESREPGWAPDMTVLPPTIPAEGSIRIHLMVTRDNAIGVILRQDAVQWGSDCRWQGEARSFHLFASADSAPPAG